MKKALLALAVFCALPVSAQVVKFKIPYDMFCDIVIEKPVEYGIWNDSGAPYNCKDGSPLVNSILLGEQFEQKVVCTQNRERLVMYRSVNLTTGELVITDTSVDKSEYLKPIIRIATGTNNAKISERVGDVDMVRPVGEPYDCKTIPDGIQKVGEHHLIERSNAPLSLEFVSRSGDEFLMSKSCSQDYEQTRQAYDVMADGKEIPSRLVKETVTRQEAFESTHSLTDGVYSEVDTFVSVRVDRSQGEGRNFYLLKVVIGGDEVITLEDKSYSSKGILEKLEKRGYTIKDVNYRVDNNYFPAATSTYKMPVVSIR